MTSIDLQKALGTIDQDILIVELRFCGGEGANLDWFISYLINRKPCCKVNGNFSVIQEIKCGVPQGSCLGTLPCLIYTNDLPLALQRTKVTMYADDTSISHSSKSVSDLCNAINSDVQNLSSWLQGNKSEFAKPGRQRQPERHMMFCKGSIFPSATFNISSKRPK